MLGVMEIIAIGNVDRESNQSAVIVEVITVWPIGDVKC